MTNRVLTVLRDLVCQAAELPDEEESTSEERAAFLAGVEDLIASHAFAQRARKLRTDDPSVRRTETDPIVSPFDGAWEILNESDSEYRLPVGADKSQPLVPGPNYCGGEDPTSRLQVLVETGALQVRPAGLYSTDWKLSQLGHERRLMACLRAKDLSAARACLPHVRHQFALNVKERIKLIEAAAPGPKVEYAKRFHSTPESKPAH